MKNARRRNILRGIRQSLNRYMSILFIVALGAGFLAGLTATSPDMYENADSYMDNCKMYDIDLKATQGLSEEDICEIEKINGIAEMQPARVLDMVLINSSSDEQLTSRVFALLDDAGNTKLNRFVIKEGRLPENTGECVVQSSAGRYTNNAPQIGDVLRLDANSSEYDTLSEYTAQETLTVVGIVESPMCISVERELSTAGTGSIALQVFVKEDYLTMDFYTDCYILVNNAAEVNTFDDSYTDLIGNVVSELEALGEVQAPRRSTELRDSIQSQIESASALLDSINNVIEIRKALASDLIKRSRQATSVASLLTDDPELAAAVSDVASNTLSEIGKAQSDLITAQTNAENLTGKIADAQSELAQLEDCTWLVRTRDDSVGYSNYKDNVQKVSALCKIFPVFFFLVALLVALTTMTRLVEERRTQIGILKALGYTDKQILGEYILYSISAAILGCALGFIVGFKLFPAVINSAYGMMYTFPSMATPFRLDIALLVAPITIGGILLATVWACYSMFISRPAQLMQVKAPVPGKRIMLEQISVLWRRIPFTHKVTCRNLFRYKKRFFMTIIGMAGCSALMLTGFGLRDSINDIVHKQFNEIDLYQMSILMDDADPPQTVTELHTLLTDTTRIADYMPYHSENGKVSFSGESESASLAVPQNTEYFEHYVVLRNRKNGLKIKLTDDGIVLTEKLCEKLNVKVGDNVTLENEDGKRASLRVIGIAENYISSYAFMTPQTYYNVFGKQSEYTTLLCNTADGTDIDELLSDLMNCEHVIYVSASSTLMSTFDDSVKSIDSIVWVLILSAGILSMVVNYNLTNVNICERKKELATIRVLGFHEREVEQYIFRETNTLSMIGTLLGLPIGIWLHLFVVRTVEVNSIMFGRNIKPLSFILAIVISMLFTIIINRLMSRSIRKVDMVESMKANE